MDLRRQSQKTHQIKMINKDDYYRLDIVNKNERFTTPNLMGVIGMEYKNKSVGTPVGEIISYMGTIAPTNYLICDETVYQISDYPILAQHFADNFGSKNYFGGNGTTTFAVPDLRGEFLRGAGSNAHSNQGSGDTVGSHQDATTQPSVFVNKSGSNGGIGICTDNVENDGWANIVYLSHNVDHQIAAVNYFGITNLSAKPNPDESVFKADYTSRPTNTSVLYCIKYQPTYWITSTNIMDEE